MGNSELKEAQEEELPQPPPESYKDRRAIDDAAWGSDRPDPGPNLTAEVASNGQLPEENELVEPEEFPVEIARNGEKWQPEASRAEGRINRAEADPPAATREDIDNAAWGSSKPNEADRPSDDPVELWNRNNDVIEDEIPLGERHNPDLDGAHPEMPGIDGAELAEPPAQNEDSEKSESIDRDELIKTARSQVEDAYTDAPDVDDSRTAANLEALDQPAVGYEPLNPSESIANSEGDSVQIDETNEDSKLPPELDDAIRLYTGMEYEPLNGALWGGTISDIEKVAPESHQLSEALKELPLHEGTVFRGSQPGRPAESYHLDRYVPGDTVIHNGYTSCTTDSNAEFNGEVLWVIESKSGRNIEQHSQCSWEHEVLFDRFTKFEVKAREQIQMEDGRTRELIYMLEV